MHNGLRGWKYGQLAAGGFVSPLTLSAQNFSSLEKPNPDPGREVSAKKVNVDFVLCCIILNRLHILTASSEF